MIPIFNPEIWLAQPQTASAKGWPLPESSTGRSLPRSSERLPWSTSIRAACGLRLAACGLHFRHLDLERGPRMKENSGKGEGGSECNSHHKWPHDDQWPVLELRRQLELLGLHKRQGDGEPRFHLVHPVHPGRANDPVCECHDAVSIVSGLNRTWIPEAPCAATQPNAIVSWR